MNIYCIFDNVAKEFGSLFLQQNNDSAVRSFKSMFHVEQKTPLNPSDFDLYLLGTFDIVNGNISPLHDLVYRGVDISEV